MKIQKIKTALNAVLEVSEDLQKLEVFLADEDEILASARKKYQDTLQDLRKECHLVPSGYGILLGTVDQVETVLIDGCLITVDYGKLDEDNIPYEKLIIRFPKGSYNDIVRMSKAIYHLI